MRQDGDKQVITPTGGVQEAAKLLIIEINKKKKNLCRSRKILNPLLHFINLSMVDMIRMRRFIVNLFNKMEAIEIAAVVVVVVVAVAAAAVAVVVELNQINILELKVSKH